MNKFIVLFGAALILPGLTATAADANALIGQGEAQMREGRLNEALSTLEQAVAADPKSSLAQTRLGGALLLKQEYGRAAQTFRQAILLDGNNANAFVGMAMAYLHSGDYGLARGALEEAKRIDPSKGAKIDELIAYIDQRDAGETKQAAEPPAGKE